MKKWNKKIANIFHFFGAVALGLIGVIFLGLIGWTFAEFALSVFQEGPAHREMLEKIFRILLYVELVAAIKIYFQKQYHFPIRFFIYIGITDMMRETVIAFHDPERVMWYSISTLILVGALFVLEYKNQYLLQKKSKQKDTQESFPL